MEANFWKFDHPYLPWGHARIHKKFDLIVSFILTFIGYKLTDRQPSKIIYRLSLILLSLNVLCMYEHNAHKYGYLFKGNVIEGIF